MTYRRLLVAVLAAGAAVVPAADAAAAKSSLGSRVLAVGSSGGDVRLLQGYLTRVGVRTSVDGYYGTGTRRSVVTWERRSDVHVDGRFQRRDARVLRAQVAAGTHLGDADFVPGGAAAPEEAAAPMAAAVTAAPAGAKATIGPDGLAVAPADAPDAVKAIIAAGNAIADFPYVYGGGHGRWRDSGYDCSGSVSYALHGAGLLDQALDSTGFMSWGEPGAGTWVTIYSNPGHAYMTVAGLRFDTSGRGPRGSRWTSEMRSSAGYRVTHPEGL